MPQLGGYPVYPGGNSTYTPWYTNTFNVTEGTEVNFPEYLTMVYGVDTASGKEFNNKKETKEMVNYYRVLSDTESFVKGAILKQSGGEYLAENDLFYTDAAEKAVNLGHLIRIAKEVVEETPATFERVYPVTFRYDTDGDSYPVTFGTKDEARAAVSASTTSTSAIV